ncbi:unnamed protein product [Ilex paraguariensis]|uniref:Uncharacterized protein n=1 Tax=Ilex paraguariensis TaxID=185542 RepID=A0ABC8U469_9AQUA
MRETQFKFVNNNLEGLKMENQYEDEGTLLLNGECPDSERGKREFHPQAVFLLFLLDCTRKDDLNMRAIEDCDVSTTNWFNPCVWSRVDLLCRGRLL